MHLAPAWCVALNASSAFSRCGRAAGKAGSRAGLLNGTSKALLFGRIRVYDAVMVSFTFATSALSAKGLARKANCSFSGRLLSKASSA